MLTLRTWLRRRASMQLPASKDCRRPCKTSGLQAVWYSSSVLFDSSMGQYHKTDWIVEPPPSVQMSWKGVVRAVPANANDSVYCANLAMAAVHGAMAGYTGITVAKTDLRYYADNLFMLRHHGTDFNSDNSIDGAQCLYGHFVFCSALCDWSFCFRSVSMQSPVAVVGSSAISALTHSRMGQFNPSKSE
eukprot:4496905-Amphidinium_carterae.1